MNHKDESDNLLSDEQLAALLRDVKVPADFADELRAIPHSQIESTESTGAPVRKLETPSESRVPWGSLLVLAASLLAVGAFFAWPWIVGDGELGTDSATIVRSDPTKPAKPNPPDSQLTPTPEPGTAELFAQTVTTTEAIEAALHEIEMQRLRKQLAQVKQSTPTYSMEPREYDSLITAIADQTILQLGGSESTVKQDMVHVIKTYPNTAGATIAQEFLDSRAN